VESRAEKAARLREEANLYEKEAWGMLLSLSTQSYAAAAKVKPPSYAEFDNWLKDRSGVIKHSPEHDDTPLSVRVDQLLKAAASLREEAAALAEEPRTPSQSATSVWGYSSGTGGRLLIPPENRERPTLLSAKGTVPRPKSDANQKDGGEEHGIVIVPTVPETSPPPPPAPAPPSALTPAALFAMESGKIDQLVTGSAAVSAPGKSKVGEVFSVYLRVSPEKLEALEKGLGEDFPGNTTVTGKPRVKLTPRMTAEVSGFGFEIAPKETQTQGVSLTEATTWPWQVKATEPGKLTLTFTLSGTLTMEGKEVPRTFYEYRQTVDVAVSPIGFFEKNWQLLATSLLIPAGGGLWAFFRRKHDAAGPSRPSVFQRIKERRKGRLV
jgi:hypothetical protein